MQTHSSPVAGRRAVAVPGRGRRSRSRIATLRATRADKARAFTVARGEAVEAAAAIEIAALLGDARAEDAERVAVLADRVVAMLTLPTQPTSVLGRLRISRDLLRVPWAETLGRRARSKRGR